MEASKQAVELMRKLLTVHYVEGGVPPEVVEVLVTCLKACGDDWFPRSRTGTGLRSPRVTRPAEVEGCP